MKNNRRKRTKPKSNRSFFNKKNHDETIHYIYKRVGRKRYKIPVDSDGYVPVWAMAQRLQEVGDNSDIDETDIDVLPTDLTPDEIIDWWIDPSSCDIEGIDTEDSSIYNMDGVPKEQIDVQRRIAVVTVDPKEQKRIRHILSESFSKEELCKMAQNGSFVIKTIEDGGDATGCYWRRQDGVEVPLIEIEKGCTADGIVHEAVHHSRAVDRTRTGKLRTTYPTDSTGRLDTMKFSKLPQKKRDQILEDEERWTTAETNVRTRVDKVQSGYYDDVPDSDPRRAYEEDMRTLRGCPKDISDKELPRLTGKAAKDAVLKGYEYSNIARAQILKRDVSKR